MSTLSFQPPWAQEVRERTGTLRRILVLSAVLALVGLASGGVAKANIQTLTVDQKATLLFGTVAVTGTIRCDAGDSFQVGTTLTETNAGGTAGGAGSFEASCTGATQTWLTSVTPSIGEFRQGSATAIVLSDTNADPATLTTLTPTIHIHR